MSAKDKAAPALAGAELKAALKSQIEFCFSRANLANDVFLVSQMNSQMYVPVDVILKFGKIQELTKSRKLLVKAVADSTVCSLNDSRDAIKPNIKSERTTIILREIPSTTPPADVEVLFEGCGRVESVRSDVDDIWFVTMASEDEAAQIMAEFSWGEEFLKINHDCLEAYAACETSDDVMAAQEAYLAACQEEHDARAKRMQLPRLDRDEDEEDEEGESEATTGTTATRRSSRRTGSTTPSRSAARSRATLGMATMSRRKLQLVS